MTATPSPVADGVSDLLRCAAAPLLAGTATGARPPAASLPERLGRPAHPTTRVATMFGCGPQWNVYSPGSDGAVNVAGWP